MTKIGLNAKMIFGGITLIVVPIVVVGFFCLFIASKSINSLAIAGAANTASQLAQLVDMTFSGEMKIVTELSIKMEEVTAKLNYLIKGRKTRNFNNRS